MAMLYMRFVSFAAPLGLSIAVFLFLTPSFKDKSLVRSDFILAVLISVGFFLMSKTFVRSIFPCFRCGTSTKGTSDENEDYYKAQYMWAKEMKYHKDHFLYKGLPETK